MDFISEPGFPPQVWILSALIVLILFVSGLKWAAAAELVGLFGVGEHWASDVLAGYLLGFIGLILTIWFYRWAQTRFGNHPERASPFVA